jgi:hypothetical protein
MRGRVIARENWYRPSDATYCLTAAAVTVQTLESALVLPASRHLVGAVYGPRPLAHPQPMDPAVAAGVTT